MTLVGTLLTPSVHLIGQSIVYQILFLLRMTTDCHSIFIFLSASNCAHSVNTQFVSLNSRLLFHFTNSTAGFCFIL